MPWKKDESGTFAVDDVGNPVWTDDNGQDKGVDYVSLSKRLAETTKESVQRKEKIRDMEKLLDPFKGIESPDEWLAEAQKALEMMRNAPDKEKALEEQVRARVEAATKPLHEKIAAEAKSKAELQARLERETLDNAVANLAYLGELDQPATAKGLFRSRLAMDADGVYVMDDEGKPMFGAEGRMTPNEGFIAFVNAHPEGQKWKRGTGGSGSGAGGGSGGRSDVNPWKKESLNSTEQMRIYNENPALARSMMKAADYTIPPGM